MKEEISKLKKLSPQERIKKLKEIEKDDEKELEELKELIKESEEEIKETRTRVREDEFVEDRLIITNLETLVTPTATEEERIEEAETVPNIQPIREYQQSILQYNPVRLYSERIEEIRNILRYDAQVSYEKRLEILNEIALITRVLGKKISDWYEGIALPTEEVARELVESYNIAKKLSEMYKG